MPQEPFRVSVRVSNRTTGLEETVDALVGGGTAVSIMPASLLRRLEIEPDRTMHFRSDDGGRVELPVGHAYFSVEGAEGSAMVVFGPEHRCELGTNTLSDLLLEPDSATQSLSGLLGLGLLPGIVFIEEDGPGN